jgi:restriction system protein
MFVDMMFLPWWMGAGAGAFFFVLAWVFVPALLSASEITMALTPIFQAFVYFLAFVSFLSAVVSLIRAFWQGKLFSQMANGRRLESLSWREFEQMLAGAFREQGYLVADNPPGPDEGIDLRLRKDGERLYVQAKHWRGRPVGVKTIRELHGVVNAGGADGGIVVSSSGFTGEAKRFARQAGVRLVGPGELRRWFRGKTVPDDTAGSGQGQEAPLCAGCGVAMVQRIARRGANAGETFWGCPNFPRCRVTRPI